jgi:glycosyltransferase involved in cell wall biosynthesis
MGLELDVFGWLADWFGCGQYRVGMPLWGLRGLGYRVMVAEKIPPELSEPASHRFLSRPTVIVGQRVCKPDPSGIWQRMAAEGFHKLVYEIDDDLFTIDPRSNPNGVAMYSDPIIAANIRRNVEVADLVTVSTPALAEVFGQFNHNVKVLPNYIAEDLLGVERPRRSRLTVGWGGSFTHLMDFDSSGPQIRRFLDRNTDVDFHCIGTDFRQHLKFPIERTLFTPWSPDFDAYYRSIDFDIGLAPLKSHVFNRSKSHIKALEYAALGIPAVVSAEPPYEDFVVHGETGYLVRRDHEWGKFLNELARDPGRREAMGAKARALAASYTIQGNAHRWRDAYGLSIKEATA